MRLKRGSRLSWPRRLTLRSHTLKERTNERGPRPAWTIPPSCERNSATNAISTFSEVSLSKTTWTSWDGETAEERRGQPQSESCRTLSVWRQWTKEYARFREVVGQIQLDSLWYSELPQSFPLCVQTVPLKRSRLCDPKIIGPRCCSSLGCVRETEVMYFLWSRSDILIMQEKGQFESYGSGKRWPCQSFSKLNQHASCCRWNMLNKKKGLIVLQKPDALQERQWETA